MHKNKHIFLIIGLSVGVLLILILAVFFLSPRQPDESTNSGITPSSSFTPEKKQTDDQKYTPTKGASQSPTEILIPSHSAATIDPSLPISPFYSEEYKRGQEKIDEQEKEYMYQSSKAGELLDRIPYEGQSFSLDYDYATFEYVLTVSKKNQAQGIIEFEEYLKENEIEDSSWLKHLRMQIRE